MFLNFRMLDNFAVIYLKFRQRGQTLGITSSKRCKWNSKQCRPCADSSRSSLMWVCNVCPNLSVRKHRIITVSLNCTNTFNSLIDYGYHTNREGHFEPVGECLMGLRYHVKQKLDTKGHSAVLVVAEVCFTAYGQLELLPTCT